MRKIILLRHSIPETGGVKMCIGSGCDPSLSAEGIRLCEKTGKLFSSLKIDNVYASPLKRARETADLLFPGVNVQIIDGLKEIYMGEWEGLSFEEIKRRFPKLYEARGTDPSLLPFGSESWEEVSERMRRAVLSTEGDCVAVTHSCAIGALILKISHSDFGSIGRRKPGYCGLAVLYEENGMLYIGDDLKREGNGNE